MDRYGSMNHRAAFSFFGATFSGCSPQVGNSHVQSTDLATQPIFPGAFASDTLRRVSTQILIYSSNGPTATPNMNIPILREFINYRHPDPRRGEPRVCSTQLDAFPEDPLDPLDPGRSGPELREAHLEAPLSQFWHIWPENGHPF